MKKFVKKLLCILLVVVALSFLASCKKQTFQYDLDNLTADVDTVDLIYYVNDNSFWYMRMDFAKPSKRVKVFYFDSAIVVKTLKSNELETFLSQICKMVIEYDGSFYNSPQGYCLKLNYNNGNFDILGSSKDFACKYDKDGTFKQFLGNSDKNMLHEIIAEYFYGYKNEAI